jgi:hypothetical protein
MPAAEARVELIEAPAGLDLYELGIALDDRAIHAWN